MAAASKVWEGKGHRISQGQNSHVDSLVELVDFPSIYHQESSQVFNIIASPNWMDPTVAFISDGMLLKDKK